MKLSKSILLSIALFGASASIFSYAAILPVNGNSPDERGNRFRELLASAVAGDEIIFDQDIQLLRGTGKLDIPNVTIKSGNNSKLHIEGYNLNLKGTATFENLNLSLKPSISLIGAFSSAGTGTATKDVTPGVIVTNGNNLTLKNVDTTVEGDATGKIRPLIVVGGGSSSEAEVLTVTGNSTNSVLNSIIVDKTKKLGDNGEFVTNTDVSEKDITINLGSGSKVLNEIRLDGFENTEAPNNKISINSETLNIGNFGNSSKDGIHIGGAKNVNLTFSNVKNTLHPLKIIDDSVGLKTLTLDNAEVILKKNSNIETLELKNKAKLSVESTPILGDDSDRTIDYRINVTTLKAGDNKNELGITGKSSVTVNAFEGNPTGLKVTGAANNFTLTDNKYTYIPNGISGDVLSNDDTPPPSPIEPPNEGDALVDDPNTPNNGSQPSVSDTESSTSPEDTENTTESNPNVKDQNSDSQAGNQQGSNEQSDNQAGQPNDSGKTEADTANGNTGAGETNGTVGENENVSGATGQDNPTSDSNSGDSSGATVIPPSNDTTGSSNTEGTEGNVSDSPSTSTPTDPVVSAEGSGATSSDSSTPTIDPNSSSAEPTKSVKEQILESLKGLSTNLNDEQQQQAVEKVESSLKSLVDTYTNYDFSFSLDAARVAENRLNDLATLNGLESAANDNYAFLAQSAKALKTHNSVWVSSSLTEQRGDSKRRSTTINLGYDRQFDNLIVGGFVSYLRQKGERGELSSKLHGYSLSLYGKYSQNAHEVVALLNVGRTKADLQRNISTLSVSNNAETKGKFVGLRAEYGYRVVFEQHGLQVKPIVALNYNLGRQAAFTESGTMPVHLGKIKAQRLALEAGVELKKYFETAYVYVKPTVQTDLMARSNDVDVRFVDTPNSIPFKSTAKKKTYFALSLGTQVQLRQNLLLDLNANSRIGNNERDLQGSVKLSYKF